MKVFFRCLLVISIFVLQACEVGPAYRPAVVNAPDNWKGAHVEGEEGCASCGQWWEVFNDDFLNDLMSTALQNNPNIIAAIERVVQARAMAGISRADLYPQITLAPSYTNQITLTEAYASSVLNNNNMITGGSNPLFRQHFMAYMLPVNLRWEIDLWGRLRNIYKSASYQAEGEYDAFRNLLLILTTDLAEAYFQLRGFDRQIDLFLKTIQTRKKALEINQARYDAKLAGYQPVAQAQLDLANVEADYHESKRQRIRQENRIATLVGINASQFFIEHRPLEIGPPQVAPGIPSDILARRPDIAQAAMSRRSTHALVRSAYANFLPSLSLTAASGFSSPDLHTFLSWHSRYWQLGANSVETIIDGGRNLSILELQWARFKESDQNYQAAVLNAFEEVESALTDVEEFYNQLNRLTTSVKASTTAYKIAYDRYFQGVTFYLEVMDSERDQLAAERSYNDVLTLRYSALIQLIKALGGSWETDCD
jgi:multidrug efflux system outer membrane protein